ncbi:MAG TPA: FecR family protein [Myxococcota bacterium]|nr:FecR family protein [Myxococcota bacterium]
MTRGRPLCAWPLPCLVLAALVLAHVPARAAQAEPRLAVVVGAVEIGRGEPPAWHTAHVGDALGTGDWLRTGRAARAEVNLGTGIARLFENSLLRLPPDGMRLEGAAAVGLDHGTSLFDVRPRRPSDPFEVRTPKVVASVKGTRFGVALTDASALVVVYTGLVAVREPAAERASGVFVRDGFSAVGGGGRPFELSLHSGGDAWGRWEKKSAAPFGPPSPSRWASAKSSPEVDAAHAAALRGTAPGVLGGALERHPEIVNGRTSSGACPKVPAEIDAVPLAQGMKPPTLPAGDPVADAGNSDPPRAFQERAAEAILNGGLSASALPTPGAVALPSAASPYSVQVVNAGSATAAVIVSAAGQPVATLSQTALSQVVQTGNTSLLGPQVLGILATTGTDPLKFATQMVKVLH